MDFMKLKATLSLDSSEYESGLNKAEGKTSKLKKGLATFGKVGVAAIGAAATATGVLIKKSVDAYAEYEQLSGGVKKLFGEQASAEVMKYANEAYKTAGMSANQYMEQATSFSAALINSLGGDQMKAAKQTDVAMKAISDNFNTFGGDITNVQNAFQGFAKQNYTMLDNLKLGYGGTKSEMQRLIDDANAYAEANGKAADLSIDSFSDIVTAIEYVQEKQGIAGTTAKEAATTIEGSLNMTKAAWQNLVAGFADPEADIGRLVQNLMESVVGTTDEAGNHINGLVDNVVPAIMQALEGAGEAIATILPELLAKIPEAMDTMVTPLLSTGLDVVLMLIQGLASSAPKLVESAAGLVKTLMGGLTKAAPQLVTSAITLVGELVIGLIQQLPSLVTAGLEMITAFVEGLGFEIISTLVVTIVTSIPQIVGAAWKLIKAMAETFSKINWLQLGKKAFNKVKDGISNMAPRIKQAVKNIVSSVLTMLGFDGIGEKVKSAFQKVVDGAKEKMDAAKEKVKSIIDAIKNFFPFSVGKIFSGWVPKIKLTASKNGDTASTNATSNGRVNFAKAMSQPYLFKRPTEFYAGDAGDEMLLGRSALKQDLADAVKGSGGDIVINLNYNASDDANAMLTDIVRGVRRYRMAGVI